MDSLTYRSATEVNDSMVRVYGQMFLAILNSMTVGYLVSSSPELINMIFGSALKWLVMFAPLVAVIAISFVIDRVNKLQAMAMLHGFAALMGLSFSIIFVIYASGSIVLSFMGAAVLFAVLSIYGYFTKSNLDSLGQFMFVGLIAIVIAAVINIFVGSTILQMVISSIAIIVFLGLTAYDTQKIREMVSVETQGNEEIRGALTLYLDFINIFLNLLQLFGIKKD
jgi:FtsH-binding integral membrane protein